MTLIRHSTETETSTEFLPITQTFVMTVTEVETGRVETETQTETATETSFIGESTVTLVMTSVRTETDVVTVTVPEMTVTYGSTPHYYQNGEFYGNGYYGEIAPTATTTTITETVADYAGYRHTDTLYLPKKIYPVGYRPGGKERVFCNSCFFLLFE